MQTVTASKPELIGLGVDWITASAESKRSKLALQRVAERNLLAEQLRGCAIEERTFQGFKGLACGGVYGGVKENRFLIRLSAQTADDNWRPVLEAAESVSRLDLQVTVRYTPADSRIAERAERRALAHKKERGTKAEVSLMRNDVKGTTLYLGQRTSYRYARLYNKHAESKLDDYEGCWRYELELHKRAAEWLRGDLIRTAEHKSMALDQVRRHFGRSGILVPAFDQNLTCAYGPRPKVDPSLARTLTWYKTQLRPSLKLTIGCGNADAAFDALGLGDHIPALLEWVKKKGSE